MSLMPILEWSTERHSDLVRQRLTAPDGGLPARVCDDARAIIADVRERGDQALLDLTARFDGVQLAADALRVDPATIRESAAQASPELADAIRMAIRNVRTFHQAQLPAPVRVDGPAGATLELIWSPVASAGLYVPGGRAAYPSTVIMNAVPALAAGVPRLAVFTVPGMVENNAAVACALHELGLTEVYRVAGAQAIAAAAFGTQSIRPVDVITGPGNAWVAAAKREVIGRVGIDSIAGPSEVLILCDDTCNPHFAALDMLAQAEHDPMARVVLAGTDRRTLDAILAALEVELATAPRRDIALDALRDHGLVLLADTNDELVEICALMAPEHLQLMLRDPPDPSQLLAGAIFIGNYTPTAVGDYIAGPNHVLPTGGACRFSGPLNVMTFLRPTSVVRSNAAAMAVWGPAGAIIADLEGLDAHARALRARTTNTGDL